MRINTNIERVNVEIDGKTYEVAEKTVSIAEKLRDAAMNCFGMPESRLCSTITRINCARIAFAESRNRLNLCAACIDRLKRRFRQQTAQICANEREKQGDRRVR